MNSVLSPCKVVRQGASDGWLLASVVAVLGDGDSTVDVISFVLTLLLLQSVDGEGAIELLSVVLLLLLAVVLVFWDVNEGDWVIVALFVGLDMFS